MAMQMITEWGTVNPAEITKKDRIMSMVKSFLAAQKAIIDQNESLPTGVETAILYLRFSSVAIFLLEQCKSDEILVMMFKDYLREFINYSENIIKQYSSEFSVDACEQIRKIFESALSFGMYKIHERC